MYKQCELTTLLVLVLNIDIKYSTITQAFIYFCFYNNLVNIYIILWFKKMSLRTIQSTFKLYIVNKSRRKIFTPHNHANWNQRFLWLKFLIKGRTTYYLQTYISGTFNIILHCSSKIIYSGLFCVEYNKKFSLQIRFRTFSVLKLLQNCNMCLKRY